MLTSHAVETAWPTDTGKRLHRLTVAQLLAGQIHTAKRVYRITNERIVNVVADYNKRTFAEFLKGIAHNSQL